MKIAWQKYHDNNKFLMEFFGVIRQVFFNF